MKHIEKHHSSEKIRLQALKQLRETRALIEEHNPKLLESVRQLIERVQETRVAMETKTPPQAVEAGEMVAIDRQKNLETILKFVGQKPGSEAFKNALKNLLH